MLSVAHQRMLNQRIGASDLRSARDVVAHLGAVQAQDYPMAKWALGVRLPDSGDADIEQAVAEGSIVRTHILRPTWHFVAADDLRWMLALTAPHVKRSVATYMRQLGLDEDTCRRSNHHIARMLEGRHMTREEIMAELQREGIPTDDLRPAHLMFSAELEAIVCSGAPRGKQQTYALLDERVAPAPAIPRDEALARLALRYFNSHGPATLKDYMWWSGLPAADARAGLEAVKSELICEKNGDTTYWFSNANAPVSASVPSAVLLPAFDEFMVAYTDRSASLDPAFGAAAISGNGIFKPLIVAEGRVVGIWKRSFKKNTVVIEPSYFRAEDALPPARWQDAAQAFGRFLDMPLAAV